MGMDFTVVFAGPDAATGEVLERVEEHLYAAAFVRTSALVRAELDVARGVFDEVQDELVGFHAITEVSAKLGKWGGAAVEFSHADAGTLYVLIARSGARFVNAWVDVSETRLRHLTEDGLRSTYYAGLNAIARGCEAAVGLGDLEIAFEPVGPDELAGKVASSRDPSQRDPTQLFIAPSAEVGPDDPEALWGPGCRGRHFVDGYVFIETAEYRNFWDV